jgi:hypothetical protein
MLAKEIRPGMFVAHPKSSGYHVVDHVKHTSRVDAEGTALLVGVHLTSNTEGVLYEATPNLDISVIVPSPGSPC